MGKRVGGNTIIESRHIIPSTPPIRSIRKRKRAALNAVSVGKALRLHDSNGHSNCWHDNLNEEDSSSNDSTAEHLHTLGRNSSTKQANNSSILLNSSFSTVLDVSVNESPKPVYTLRPSVVNGTILYDLAKKPWRLGRPIGKGNFGEIFLASNNIAVPVTNENAKFVVKIEPHSNGPLFVEIHCLMNAARKCLHKDDEKSSQNIPSGIPDYIASGSHYFGDARYRFLVLERFDCDLHSLIKHCRLNQKYVLTLAINIVTVLEKLHDKGYVHNDVKAQNLMISKCKYYRNLDNPIKTTNETRIGKNADRKALLKAKYDDQYDDKQQTTDSGNSSEQEPHEDDDDDMDFVIKRKVRSKYKYNDDVDEDFDDGATSQSNNSNSVDIYETPVNKNRKRRQRGAPIVEYSGSNPVRACRRRQPANSIYEEMVKSHYLRPAKRISYSEFFNEDASTKNDDDANSNSHISSDAESEEFLPQSVKRNASKSKSSRSSHSVGRRTRQHEKQSITSVSHSTSQQQPADTTLTTSPRLVAEEEERIFLIDFGLASKFIDNGVHRPFIMDQRRAHDGTLEFTSRDAHMGAHSRRSDLECLGYNLIFWSQGYLPWKEAAVQHQQEKVHQAKEYLMTDVREILKQIYGNQVPKFLGEFLHHVSQLAYHERPDYARYRRLFERQYQQLGYSMDNMRIDRNEIKHSCVRFKEEIENKKDIFEINKLNISCNVTNLTLLGTPFHERTFSNRVSPKNLRSKSEKKDSKKKFSWAEILSQDPDQIARERAEKEFDRAEKLSDIRPPTVRRYQGKPTYAILEVQRRMKLNARIVHSHVKDTNGGVEGANAASDAENGSQNSLGSDADNDEDEHTEVEEETEEEEDDDAYECENEEEESDGSKFSEVSIDTSKLSKIRSSRSKRITRAARKQKSTTTVSSHTASKTKAAISSYKTRTRRTTATVKTLSAPEKSNCCRTTRSIARKTSGGTVAKVAIAAAAGEHLHLAKTQPNSRVENYRNAAAKPTERRARRCLIKTDAEVMTAEEDSNSNFSPDMRGLFNVWKKINNESVYLRGSNAATAKHLRK